MQIRISPLALVQIHESNAAGNSKKNKWPYKGKKKEREREREREREKRERKERKKTSGMDRKKMMIGHPLLKRMSRGCNVVHVAQTFVANVDPYFLLVIFICLLSFLFQSPFGSRYQRACLSRNSQLISIGESCRGFSKNLGNEKNKK